LRQSLQHNSCYISNDSVCLTKIYVFTHSRLFEWETSSKFFLWNRRNGILHVNLKWDNELICNIQLNISSSLVVIWMVFIVYLHFAIYHDNSNFLTYKLFSHLISISKWDFFGQSKLFFGFWTMLFQIPFAKNPFNIIW
jgi:hypothetical protein